MNLTSDIIELQKEFPLLSPNEDLTAWEGYLASKNPLLKVKIWTPHYPDLKNFKCECSPFMKTSLMSEVHNLKGCKTLQGLLFSMIHLVKTKMSLLDGSESLWGTKLIKSTHTILCELEATIAKENVMLIGDNFRDIKIKYCDSRGNDHILMFQMPIDYPKGYIAIIEADLPLEILSSLSNTCSIQSLYNLFKENVEALLPFWNVCKVLEEKCWVVDPATPKKRDVYRRILLNDHLSVMLTFNPLKVNICPDVKFIGSMNAVTAVRAKYLKNIDMIGWDEDLDVAENLCQLLDVESLPVKTVTSPENESAENECYICFTYVVDDEEPPSKWCSNNNCSSWYHYACLVQWLETVVSSVRMYDHISGPCPYCDEKIWCPLKNEAS